MFPKISIVTPSFNQGQYIEQTLLSVINQNYPNLEYIIIDGGSTDDTVDIIKRYEKHLTYWISEPDKGQTDAINKGFAKCTGDIFNWINSDDYYEPGAFLKLKALFNKNVDVVCGKEWGFNDSNFPEKRLHAGSIIKKNVYETIRVGIIDQPCTFFRKKKIDDFFPLDDSLKYVMDRQLWWSYLLKFGQKNILQTNEVFTNFRIHPLSKSTSEGDLFEAEFDRLKLTLFNQLHAPNELQCLFINTLPLNEDWSICLPRPNHILAAFAEFYGERYFIKNDLPNVSKFIRLVKKWKGVSMNKKVWKLWILSVFFPHKLTMFLKRIKK